MIKTKYMFSEAKAKAKDMTSCPRGQGNGLEDSISDKSSSRVNSFTTVTNNDYCTKII